MKKFAVRTVGSDRVYEVLGGDWVSLERLLRFGYEGSRIKETDHR